MFVAPLKRPPGLTQVAGELQTDPEGPKCFIKEKRRAEVRHSRHDYSGLVLGGWLTCATM